MDIAVNNKDLIEIIKVKAKFYGLDANLVQAICQVESAMNPYAVRYEDHYNYLYKVKEYAKKLHITEATETILQKMSYGLMQVMGGVMREYGFAGSMMSACDPYINLEFGCRHLSKFLVQHGDIKTAASAYNCGTPKRDAHGAFKNQIYVDKVMAAYYKIKQSTDSAQPLA